MRACPEKQPEPKKANDVADGHASNHNVADQTTGEADNVDKRTAQLSARTNKSVETTDVNQSNGKNDDQTTVVVEELQTEDDQSRSLEVSLPTEVSDLIQFYVNAE